METMASYFAFMYDKAAFRGISDSIIHFLRDVQTDTLQIRSGDPRHECFADSAYSVYENIIAGNSVRASLEMVSPVLITALVFQHRHKANNRGIRFEMGELWPLLPNLFHLSYLELYDDFVSLDRRTILPNIRLPSLLSLIIHSPIRNWLLYSFKHDTWMGLFGILRSLDAPNIETMTLYGSVQRIRATMMQATTRPVDLTLFITTFDEGVDEPPLDPLWVWQGLRRITIVLPETDKAFSRLTMPSDLLFAVQSLLSLLPRGSPKRFSGSDELLSILESNTLGIEEYDIRYTYRNAVFPVFSSGRVTSLELWQSIPGPQVPGPLLIELLKNVEYIYLMGDQSILDVLDRFHGYSPHLPPWELPIKLLDSDIDDLLDTSKYTRLNIKLPNLTTLRCDVDVATIIVTQFDVPCLHSITLSYYYSAILHFKELSDELCAHADQLKHLTVLGMETIPRWPVLVDFIKRFRGPSQKISVITLPDLPHPSILRLLVDSLQTHPPSRRRTNIIYGDESQYRESNSSGCFACFSSGLVCHDLRGCRRFFPNNPRGMVSITKDTVVDNYMGEDDEKMDI